MHIAISSGNQARVGGTDSLNTPSALTDNFEFHPSKAPFFATSVLTTYTKITSADCEVSVVYDDRIAPRNGFHTGAATITPSPVCGPGSCIDIEFEHPQYNEAGKCRFKFNNACAAV